MVLLLHCLTHNLPKSKLCAMHSCCQLLCDHCYQEHSSHSQHHIAICLNSAALKYFQQITGKIQQKMMEWSERMKLEGFGAVIELNGEDCSFWQQSQLQQKLCLLGLASLEAHAHLMARNKSFVSTNQDSPTLYHPEFLKDIYNLIIHPWEYNAQVILMSINRGMQEMCEGRSSSLPLMNFRRQLVLQIQKYREELIQQTEEILTFTCNISEIRKEKKASSIDMDTNEESANSTHTGREERQKDISPFQLIEEEMYQLRLENNALKNENSSLKEDNQILKQKCERISSQRRLLHSSSKKHKEPQLNSQLFSQIVELQSQLHDNHHDLQLLISYLNSLTIQQKITPLELHTQLSSLRTIQMQ